MSKYIWSQGCKMPNKRVNITKESNGNVHIHIKSLHKGKVHQQNLFLKEDTTITLMMGLIKLNNETKNQ